MAKLILKIDGMTSSSEMDDSDAIDMLNDAWDVFHRSELEATRQEKMDWLIEKFSTSMQRAAERKERMESNRNRKEKRMRDKLNRKNKPRFK